MVTEEKKEIDHVRDWFVHDSNSSLFQIISCIETAMEKPNHGLRDHWLKSAVLYAQEALYLNSLLSIGEKASKHVSINLIRWIQHRSYPKIELICPSNQVDIVLRSGNDAIKVVKIVAELSKNAHKAGAKNMRIVFREDGIHISNDGKPIEDNPLGADIIFEEGYSTFGTTGLGLNICQSLAEDAEVELKLTYTNPVTFLITKK